MNRSLRISLVFLAFCLLALPLIACGSTRQDSTNIIGRWRIISYVTDDGQSAPVENELDMIFYSTGIGEAQVDGATQYMFDYKLKAGKLLRVITRGGQTDEVSEPYQLSKDGTTLTVYSPEDCATITMQKITSDVKIPIDFN